MRVAILGICAALAACGQQSRSDVDVRNATIEEVANEVAEASGAGRTSFIRPGQWQSTMTVEEMSAPGLPAQIAEEMKRTMVQRHSSESCLAPEDAERPRENFFVRDQQCRYDHFKMGDGKIDAKMRCDRAGMQQLIEMAGTYSPETYDMRMSISTEAGAGPGGEVRMRMRVEAKRVGECAEKQA